MFKNVRGMRDFPPEKKLLKQFIEDTCRKVFEKYGFLPLETPAVEEFGLLNKKGAGGEEIREEIYYFKDKSGRELGLRFDLTVPLARFVANNPNLPKPFKRYQIEKVWRYDRPQSQRYREFTQADIDIIGTSSMLAEFECIAVAVEIFQKLGLKFEVRLNNRKLLEDLAKKCGVKKEEINDCLRCLDKLEKIGWKEVEKEFKDKKLNMEILEVLQKKGFEKIVDFVGSSEGLKEINELLKLLREQKLEKFVKVDLCLARGLEYYTGTVFEVVAGGKFSCGGGGRFDNLIALYGGANEPAVGISFGIDRLVDVLERKVKLESNSKIFVVPVGENAMREALTVTQRIRALGINCEIDLMQRGISKNLNYVNKRGIPFVAIIGEKEIQKKELSLKEMKTGKQSTLKFKELEKLKKLIA